MREARLSWKNHIARNFDRAANSYDSNSPVQKQAAIDLYKLISQNIHAKNIDILEIGCGTGYLTRELYREIPEAKWLVSDIAPQMVARCVETMPQSPNLSYAVLDAEELNRPERFDLICSNLTAQWFEDTASSFQNLISHLKPGGMLAISTLGPNTFSLWRESFAKLGKDPVMPEYMAIDELRCVLPQEGDLEITQKNYSAEYNSAYEFARALKDIGAHAHSGDSKQLAPGSVRAILRSFEELHKGAPVLADYEVYFLIFRKPVK